MVLVETKPQINEFVIRPTPDKRLCFIPTENFDIPSSNSKDIGISLHFISEGCSKYRKRTIFKEIYQNIMDENPNALYQEKLDLSAKYITELQEQNPDIHLEVFKSMKRSFAAKTGYEITKFRKEMKLAESVTTLPNGKEIKNKHPWSSAIDKVLGENFDDKQAEKKVLIKIIDFRNKLKSIIFEKDINNPEETLKICGDHFANLVKNNNSVNHDSFLDDNYINRLINPKRITSTIYMSPMALNNEPLTLNSWVSQVIRNNTPFRFNSNK
jgi:hypothetical protein